MGGCYGVRMSLLRCSECFGVLQCGCEVVLECCYAFARLFWVFWSVAMWLLGYSENVWSVAMQLQGSFECFGVSLCGREVVSSVPMQSLSCSECCYVVTRLL